MGRERAKGNRCECRVFLFSPRPHTSVPPSPPPSWHAASSSGGMVSLAAATVSLHILDPITSLSHKKPHSQALPPPPPVLYNIIVAKEPAPPWYIVPASQLLKKSEPIPHCLSKHPIRSWK